MAAQHWGATRRAWLWYTVAGIGASAAFFLLPAAQDEIYLLIGLSAVVAIGIGRDIHRTRQRGWRTLGVGIFLYCLGDLVYTVIAASTGTEPFPSLADGPYLLGQVLVVVGILRLAAPIERGLYRPASIDAALVATAGLFVAWPLVLDPMAIDQVDPLSAVVALAYPLLDIVLVGVLARHVLQPGPKTRSLLLMLTGAVVWLVTDLAYARLSGSGEYVSGMWLDAGWLLGYVLFGAAALHPSMAQVVAVGETHEATISNRRMAFMAGVLLFPITAFALHGPPDHPIDMLVFAIGAFLVLSLGSFRLVGALLASRVLLAEQRVLEAELDRRARTDRLTGLANRAALRDRIAAARGQGEQVGLVYLDLDDFKRINDAFGHPVGEGVLREVASRLLSVAAVPEDVAHVGGDEFAIVVARLRHRGPRHGRRSSCHRCPRDPGERRRPPVPDPGVDRDRLVGRGGADRGRGAQSSRHRDVPGQRAGRQRIRGLRARDARRGRCFGRGSRTTWRGRWREARSSRGSSPSSTSRRGT